MYIIYAYDKILINLISDVIVINDGTATLNGLSSSTDCILLTSQRDSFHSDFFYLNKHYFSTKWK